MAEIPSKSGLSAFALKLSMAALMVLDHLYAFFPGQPDWFHWLGRLVAPVFCFLMTESLRHSRNRGRYLQRLTAAGAAMFAGNFLLMWIFQVPLDNNIFLSLAASAGIICLLEEGVRQGSLPRLCGAGGLFLFATLFCEGGPIIPVMAVVFYFLHHRPVWMTIAYLLSGVLSVSVFYAAAYHSAGQPFRLEVTFPQMLMLLAILPILLYNGERGPGGRGFRRFFYLFYPLHIWAFYLIARLG